MSANPRGGRDEDGSSDSRLDYRQSLLSRADADGLRVITLQSCDIETISLPNDISTIDKQRL